MCIGKYDPAIADKKFLYKSHYIHLGLAHTMFFPMTIYEEIGISGQDGHSLPHGNINLLSVIEKTILLQQYQCAFMLMRWRKKNVLYQQLPL